MSTGLEEETTQQHDVKKETQQQHEAAVKKENGIINQTLPPNFPDGLRVMVIDDDPVFLQHMDKLLKELLYQVTTYNGAAVPLFTLRAERNNFDIAFCSLHLANKDGFKLLKQILTEMDIPVVMMMSSEDNNDIVIKCLTEGACDCLIKPVERKDIQLIFKHVIRRMMVGHSNGTCICECHQRSTEKSDFSAPVLGNSKRGRKRINGEVINKVEDSSGMPMAKKTRVVWTDELNRKFNAVIEKIGIDKAVPKKILELMNVPGLTRENVASHLQKHRLSHRKTQGYPECNPNTLINQPVEALLAPLSLEESVNHQYFNKFQNHGAMGGQLGRSTGNALDPSLINNGRFRQDYSNFVAKHGYMPHQSPMRGHRLSPLMGQQMFPNGQDNNVRAPAYNPYYGGDPRTDYRAAGFPQNYPSMDGTFELPNFSMIEMSHPNSIDESCMKWKHPPYAGSHLDSSNSMYPPSAMDQYSLHNSQKNNHGHSDIIILSHHNDQHHESLTGAHLLKPPGIEGAEPKSETTFEEGETKSDE